MLSSHLKSDRLTRRRCAGLMMGLASVAALGCAAPRGRDWTNFRTRHQVDQVAADSSFPTAAEAGLAATDETAAGPPAAAKTAQADAIAEDTAPKAR
jgi:hypothetical protein